MSEFVTKDGKCYRVIYSRFITRNGKRIYPKKARAFRFLIEETCPPTEM